MWVADFTCHLRRDLVLLRLCRLRHRAALTAPWRHVEAVGYGMLEWVDWFNDRPLLEPIGNVPRAEFEASFHRLTGQPPMEAPSKPGGLRKSRGGSKPGVWIWHDTIDSRAVALH